MRYIAIVAAVAVLSACTPSRPRPNAVPQSANPSAIIAADIAFNRLAQEKGQWTAFRETAAKQATMFVPEAVDAQTWLKGRADPAEWVKWQSHKAFMSCDITELNYLYKCTLSWCLYIYHNITTWRKSYDVNDNSF